MFGEPNFVGQYTVPVKCIKKGFRSVQLKNSHSEDLELAGKFIKQPILPILTLHSVKIDSMLYSSN